MPQPDEASLKSDLSFYNVVSKDGTQSHKLSSKFLDPLNYFCLPLFLLF